MVRNWDRQRREKDGEREGRSGWDAHLGLGELAAERASADELELLRCAGVGVLAMLAAVTT